MKVAVAPELAGVMRENIGSTAERPVVSSQVVVWRPGHRKLQAPPRECEVITLNSLRAEIGVGSSLLGAAREAARAASCRRIWLITTNDNLAALKFYQKRGWRLAAIHRDALEESRRLKPEIPRVGIDGIPLRDEIELEIPL